MKTQKKLLIAGIILLAALIVPLFTTGCFGPSKQSYLDYHNSILTMESEMLKKINDFNENVMWKNTGVDEKTKGIDAMIGELEAKIGLLNSMKVPADLKDAHSELVAAYGHLKDAYGILKEAIKQKEGSPEQQKMIEEFTAKCDETTKCETNWSQKEQEVLTKRGIKIEEQPAGEAPSK